MTITSPDAPAPNPGWVSTRISFLDRDGATKTYEISLSIGASEADIAFAIDQAERQRDALMARFHYQGPVFNPAEMLMGFGKYRGRPLGWIVRNDRRYVEEYLLTLPDLDSSWRQAFTEVIEMLSEDRVASYEGEMPL